MIWRDILRFIWRRDNNSAFLLSMELSHEYFSAKDMKEFGEYLKSYVEVRERKAAR